MASIAPPPQKQTPCEPRRTVVIHPPDDRVYIRCGQARSFDEAINGLLPARIATQGQYDLAPTLKNGELRILVLDNHKTRVRARLSIEDHPLFWCVLADEMPAGVFVDHLLDARIVD